MSVYDKIDRAVSLTLSAGVIIAVVVLVEGRMNPRAPTIRPVQRVEYVKDWRERVTTTAVKLGDMHAAVEVVVFTDFACAFCRQLDSVRRDVEADATSGVARTVVHFPVGAGAGSHKAAVAFECASEQGRAKEMSRLLYSTGADMSSQGLKATSEAVGVADSARFANCVNSNRLQFRVDAGISWGNELALAGTPAALVNGWLVEPATPARIKAAVSAVRSGKSPSDRGVL